MHLWKRSCTESYKKCCAHRHVKRRCVHSKRTTANTAMTSYLAHTPKRTCGCIEYKSDFILTNAPSAPQIYLPSRSGHISPSVAIFLARFRLFSLGISLLALWRMQNWISVLLAVKCHGVSSLSAAVFSTTRSVSVLNVCFFLTRVRSGLRHIEMQILQKLPPPNPLH